MNATRVMDTDQISFEVSTEELNVQALAIRAIPVFEKIISRINGLMPQANDVDKILAYGWAYDAKHYAILVRNAMLELLKLEQYVKDGWRSEKYVESYKTSLRNTLKDAFAALIESLESILNGDGKVSEDWKHQVSPHQILSSQIKILEDQIKMIQRSQHKIDRMDVKISNFKTSYKDLINQRQLRLEKIHDLLLVVANSIPIQEKMINIAGLELILSKTQNALNELELLPALSSYEHIVLEDVDKLKIPVSSERGKLVYKSIEVLSEVSGWISINVDNPLKSVDAKIHSYSEQVRSGLLQVLNRLKVKIESKSIDLTVKRKDALFPIDKLIQEYNTEIKATASEKLDEIKQDIVDHIQTSQIFSREHNFLPTITLDQMTSHTGLSVIEQRNNWNNIRENVSKWTDTLFSKYTDEEQLSASGYINRVLSFDPNSDVNALFLRKGFLGSSFTIDRKDIIYKISSHYHLWMKGYGGSLLLKGGHGTGRTTLLEMIPIMYPDMPSYHIINDQKLEVNGHTIDIRNNLEKAINHIVNLGEKKCIVTIDDIGDYTNSPESTYDLMTNVLKLVRKHNVNIYFVITMHTYLAERLGHYFDLENPFNEIISVDIMSSRSIQEAVMIRANAVANLEQLEKEGETIMSLTRKVSKKARNNVGRAMQLWCMMNAMYENDSGDLKFRQLVKKNQELIKLLFANGVVYESYLCSMLNEIDSTSFKSNIKYLLDTKLLVRKGVGYISVNPYLQSTIEAIIN